MLPLMFAERRNIFFYCWFQSMKIKFIICIKHIGVREDRNLLLLYYGSMVNKIQIENCNQREIYKMSSGGI